MNNLGLATFWTAGGDFGLVTAGVADEGVGIGVKGEREEARGTEGLPAAVGADGHRGGAATVMEDNSLVMLAEVAFDGV